MNKMEFDIVISAFKAGAYIEQTLDSVFINIDDCTDAACHIYLGIDACRETMAEICQIYAKYDARLQVYWSETNVGTYVLKNSLSAQIDNEDAYIYFFDSDDILPQGFLRQYISYANSLPDRLEHGILRTMMLNIPDHYLLRLESGHNCASNHAFGAGGGCDRLTAQIQSLTKSMYHGHLNSDEENHLARLIMRQIRQIAPAEEIYYKPGKHETYGPIIVRLNTFKSMGGYNNARIDQDNDLLQRAKLLRLNVERNADLKAFLRRVHSRSLTGDQKTAFLSDNRMAIRAAAESRRRMGHLQADYVRTPLTRVC